MTFIAPYIASLDEYREQHPRPSGMDRAVYHARTRREWASETLHRLETLADAALDRDDPFQYIIHLTRVVQSLVEDV